MLIATEFSAARHAGAADCDLAAVFNELPVGIESELTKYRLAVREAVFQAVELETAGSLIGHLNSPRCLQAPLPVRTG